MSCCKSNFVLIVLFVFVQHGVTKTFQLISYLSVHVTALCLFGGLNHKHTETKKQQHFLLHTDATENVFSTQIKTVYVSKGWQRHHL